MSPVDKHECDEQLLTHYLLGGLSEEDAERVDRWSVSDDDFAWHLDAVENDLVDAYVRGELSGDALDRFEQFYLSSPKRLAKVEFARTLLRVDEGHAQDVAQVRAASPSRQLDLASKTRVPPNWFPSPGSGLQWAFAGAALLILVGAGYVLVQNEHLGRQGREGREQQAALDRRAQGPAQPLGEQRSPSPEMQKELEGQRKPPARSGSPRSVAFLLMPQTREAARIPTISLPPGTEEVKLRLQLESDAISRYRVVLKDPGANRVVWESSTLNSTAAGENREVAITLAPALLRPRNYVLELFVVTPTGAREFQSSYVFRAVME